MRCDISLFSSNEGRMGESKYILVFNAFDMLVSRLDWIFLLISPSMYLSGLRYYIRSQ